MILDLAVPVAATVRRQRARTTSDCLFVVEKPFLVKDVAPEDLPYVGACPQDGKDMLFKAKKGFHAFDGGFWTEVAGTPDDALNDTARDHALRLHARFLKVESDRPHRERLTKDQVAEVLSSNEDEIVPAVQRWLDAQFLVSDGRVFVRSRIPVLVDENVSDVSGYSRFGNGLPVCMWDVDADLLKKMFPGRSEAALAKALPRIERPDLLDFDRDSVVAKRVASLVCRAFRASGDLKVRNPLSEFSRLERLVASKASVGELVAASTKALEYGRALGIAGIPVSSVIDLGRRHAEGPRTYRGATPPEGRSSVVRIDLAKFGAKGSFVESSVPVVDASDHPVVAIYRPDGSVAEEGVDLRSAAGCMLLPMDRPLNTYGAMRTDGTTDPKDAAHAADAVRMAADWYGLDLGKGDHATIASAVAEFVSSTFVSIDGLAWARSGEPVFVVDHVQVGIVGSAPGGETETLRRYASRLAEHAVGSRKTGSSGCYAIPVTLSDAHAFRGAVSIDYADDDRPKRMPGVEILDQSALSLRTEHVTAAFAASMVLRRMREAHLPPSLSKTVVAAADAVRAAFDQPPHRVGEAQRREIVKDLTAFAQILVSDFRLEKLRDVPAATRLAEMLLLEGPAPTLGIEDVDDSSPIAERDPEDGAAFDFGM